ncbi:MAG: RNA methyltransferase [Candidatus Tectomicrobia bacterium]|uniref:tRNA (cytidine/uridine-2'-O-)-methyltransferase TrmJ n=1 Tax=Tectimicrobiota bacterium TaxID=2528274 RepID=A0A932HWL9_UNCTE|nr:RNA methyltransferase [Candidatus Tectomicrobia bacterium]
MDAPASLQQGPGFAVVLVRPQGSGNIGAIARSMAHFGLERLRLVAPRGEAASLEARQMAMTAQPLLARAEHFASLREATGDCGWLVATSRRLGQNRLPTLEPREGAPELLRRAARTRVALVFGPEDKGLRTDEMDLCQERLLIPALPGADSLNLAQAALLVFWELYRAKTGMEGEAALAGEDTEIPSREEVEGLVDHLLATLEEVGFLHYEPEQVARTFRRMIDRAGPDRREVRMLRGALRQLGWKLGRPADRDREE